MEILNTLADVGFVAPSLAAALLMLMARGEANAALRWGGAFALAAATTGFIKSLLRGGADLPHFPSGHVCVAVAFYGGLLFVLTGARRIGLLFLLALAAIALVSGWARVETTQHTWTDVLGGFAIGAFALLLLAGPGIVRPVDGRTRAWMLAAILLALPAGFASYSWLGHSWRMLVE
jgi:membrane-associated phospholipid phosphatase